MFISKIRTVIRYCRVSWDNSAFVLTKSNKHSRIYVYFDLVFSFIFLGDDFNDYCTFKFWDKSLKERNEYISCKRNDTLRFALCTPESYQLFLDKEAFNCHFSNYIRRKWITTKCHSIEEIRFFLNTKKSVIAKPINSYGGYGVFLINKESEDFDSQIHTLIEKIKTGSNYILEELLTNCAELQAICPTSLNTLRFVTVIDKKNNLHILSSVLRVGDGISITDNYHSGGMACALDIETGRLKGLAQGDYCSCYSVHPFSKFKFDGFLVPDFEKCVEMVKELAFVVPQARYVGWDLALTDNGIELLEGNIPPGEDITQIGTGYGVWHQLKEWI